jgi:hypothetical protein
MAIINWSKVHCNKECVEIETIVALNRGSMLNNKFKVQGSRLKKIAIKPEVPMA